MAIQFNLNALSRFSNVNFGDNDAIANLDGGNGKFPRGASVEPQTRIAISNYADMFNMSYRYEMYGALNDALGIDNANVDMLEARDDKTLSLRKARMRSSTP